MTTKTTVENTYAHFGDLGRFKRIPIQLSMVSRPEKLYSGYVIASDVNDQHLSFFSTQKFKMEETLTARWSVEDQDFEYTVKIAKINEQISTGRVIRFQKTSNQDDAAKSFYRYFSAVKAVKKI